MTITRATLLLATLILSAFPVAGSDLAKIDRHIKKEPAYQGKPKYCLLVFGPEAKHRVWLGLSRICWPLRRFSGSDLFPRQWSFISSIRHSLPAGSS